LCERLDIPVFHDDQHGTAIVIAAGLLNALDLQGKKLEEATIVCAGAGAAGIASMDLLIHLGARRDHLFMVDRTGVVHSERQDLNEYKQAYAVKTDKRTLTDALAGADIFIGVSGPGVMTSDMLMSMAEKPIVFALSNPVPEIMPEIAKSVRDDLILATGRSDYPNQVNNALCFPYIFKGALDVRASCINEAMKLAAVHALKDLTRESVPEVVLKASHQEELKFGAEYILPKLVDPRLCEKVSTAVAKAAIASGVASLEFSAKESLI
jgi:malate dehydrogenase (oxaloacetate-decarboxylating)(NADP+)